MASQVKKCLDEMGPVLAERVLYVLRSQLGPTGGEFVEALNADIAALEAPPAASEPAGG